MVYLFILFAICNVIDPFFTYFTVFIYLGTLSVAHVQPFPSTKSEPPSVFGRGLVQMAQVQLFYRTIYLRSSSWNFLTKFLFLTSPPFLVLAHSISWMPASRETEYLHLCLTPSNRWNIHLRCLGGLRNPATFPRLRKYGPTSWEPFVCNEDSPQMPQSYGTTWNIYGSEGVSSRCSGKVLFIISRLSCVRLKLLTVS